MVKKIFLAFFFSGFLFAGTPQKVPVCGPGYIYKELVSLNKDMAEVLNRYKENKNWNQFLFSIGDYMYLGYKPLMERIPVHLSSAQKTLDSGMYFITYNMAENCKNFAVEEMKKDLNRLNSLLRHDPHNMCVYVKFLSYITDYFKRFYGTVYNLQYYGALNKIFYSPVTIKEKDKKYYTTLEYVYRLLSRSFTIDYNVFRKDVEKHPEWFLRYFGKSFKHCKVPDIFPGNVYTP